VGFVTGKSKEQYVPAGRGKLPTRGIANENGEASLAVTTDDLLSAGQDEFTKTRFGLIL
jgi:hypothetical protein